MKFTKLEHSGCIIEDNGKKLVCDPVEIKQQLPEMRDVVAVILTHKHGDHYQSKCLEAILSANPKVRIFVPVDFDQLEIAGRTVERIEGEIELDVENFNLKFFGHDHAAIVPGQVPCTNIGVVVNDSIVNPGDSFDRPSMTTSPKLLLVPCAAPWLKTHESMDYIEVVKPEMAVPVHDAILSEFGRGISDNWLKAACEERSVKFMALDTNDSIEI